MQKMAWLIWTEPDPEMIKAKGGLRYSKRENDRKNMVNAFFLLPFCEKRRRWEEWSD